MQLEKKDVWIETKNITSYQVVAWGQYESSINVEQIKDVYILTEDEFDKLLIRVHRHAAMDGLTLEKLKEKICQP